MHDFVLVLRKNSAVFAFWDVKDIPNSFWDFTTRVHVVINLLSKPRPCSLDDLGDVTRADQAFHFSGQRTLLGSNKSLK